MYLLWTSIHIQHVIFFLCYLSFLSHILMTQEMEKWGNHIYWSLKPPRWLLFVFFAYKILHIFNLSGLNYQPAVRWDLTSYLCESYLCELVFVCMLTATFFFIFVLDCTNFLQSNAGFESASTFTLVFQTNRLTMWANQP